MPTCILALDQSPEVSGWAVGVGSAPKPEAWGEIKHANYGGNEALLMVGIYEQIINLAKAYGADAICTEEILIYPGRIEINDLHKQFAVYDAIAFACGKALMIDHFEAKIPTWRKYFLGAASGPKGSVKGWAKDKAKLECAEIGLLIESHHTAEAVGIWFWAQQEVDADFRRRDGARHGRACVRREAERRAIMAPLIKPGKRR